MYTSLEPKVLLLHVVPYAPCQDQCAAWTPEGHAYEISGEEIDHVPSPDGRRIRMNYSRGITLVEGPLTAWRVMLYGRLTTY